ncbi:hypothetical protein, partial [Bacteroides thetaiotaomicron]|uniref:hypothetical protein n=1 Tax=Bacteroides thetaiotaomicron TaxID=818 RepID=UPI001A93978E
FFLKAVFLVGLIAFICRHGSVGDITHVVLDKNTTRRDGDFYLDPQGLSMCVITSLEVSLP